MLDRLNPGSLRGYVARMRRLAEDYIREELTDQVEVGDPKQAARNVGAEREHLRGVGLRVRRGG